MKNLLNFFAEKEDFIDDLEAYLKSEYGEQLYLGFNAQLDCIIFFKCGERDLSAAELSEIYELWKDNNPLWKEKIKI